MIAPAPKRRWLQPSLRTLIVFAIPFPSIPQPNEALDVAQGLFPMCAAPVSWVVLKRQQAEREWEADKMFRKRYMAVIRRKPPIPKWVRSLLSDDLFRSVREDEKFFSCPASIHSMPREPSAPAWLRNLLSDLFCGVDEVIICEGQAVNAHLEYLKAFSNLRLLCLLNANITDAELEHIRGLTQLEVLDLQHNPRITDAALEHLKGLTQLRQMALPSQLRTSDVLKKLRRALPKCEM